MLDIFRHEKNQKGFTLTELLVVIAVTGLLSSIIFVIVSGSGEQGRIAKGLFFGQHLQNSLGSYAAGTWTLDEGTGTTANDISGWGNNGTIYGAAFSTDTPAGSGHALSFNGSGNYVDMGNNASLRPTEAITFEMWFKPLAYPTTETWKWRPLSNITATYKGYNFEFSDTSGLISARFGNGTDSWQNMNVGIAPLGKWSHFTATFTENGQAFGYLNGAQTVSRAVGSLDPGTGNLQLSGQYYLVNGLIDEVRIYATALTASQVQSRYYAGLEKLLAGGWISAEEYRQGLVMS